jgi:glycosyltransferase involved in cell wall biosynthesis
MCYINTVQIGGAERVIVNLSQKFAEDGNDVLLITSYHVPDGYAVDPRVKYVTLENEDSNRSKLKKNLDRTRKLRKLCLREKPDILISFMPEPNFRALLATRGTRTKNLISVRNDPNKEYGSKLYRMLAKLLYPTADGCVFQTPDAQKWFPQGIQARSRIIMNQVDEKFNKVVRSDSCSHVISCGRLVKQKNYPMLIKAFSKIADQYPDENLLIYGEGDMRSQLEALIDSLNLGSRVILKGTSNNIPEILSCAKVFVLPSDIEGMPNALLEAMAAGVPSISTDCPCGGPRMIIRDGINGLLVETGNAAAMAEAISKLLGNPDTAEEMGRQAKEDSRMYSSQNVFGQWKKYVGDLIGENIAAARPI